MLHRFKSCGLVVGLLLLTLTTSVPQELELDVGQVITAAQEWAMSNTRPLLKKLRGFAVQSG